MTEISPATSQPTAPPPDEQPATGRSPRLVVFVVLAIAWLGFLAFGQVRARFWIRNEFQVEFKSITGVWNVLVGELPGGDQQWMFQTLVIVSLTVIVVGVIACLYLLLMTPVEESQPDQATS